MKTKVKIVVQSEKEDTPCWPCINYPYDRTIKEITGVIFQNNPDMDFDVASYTSREQAEADFENDSKIYDGFLVLLMSCWKEIDSFYCEKSLDGYRVIIADVPFCGSGSALRLVSYQKKIGSAVPLLATCDYGEIAGAVRIFDVINKMKNSTIIVVSDKKDGATAEKTAGVWGCKVEYVNSAKMIGYIESVDDDGAVNGLVEKWVSGAEAVIEPAHEELVVSARVHLAVARLCDEYGASAVTVDCLGLSYSGAYGKNVHFYPCMSFFEMSDNGKIGICEADIDATVSAMLIRYMTGRPGYVSDPVIDTHANQIIYAHCVACRKVFGENNAHSSCYYIRSHAEDKKGAAVQVILPTGEKLTTIMVQNGSEKGVVHSSVSEGNVAFEAGCRTKLAARANTEKILENWDNSWHRVTVYGDYRKQFINLFKTMRIPFLEEDR